jgi:hypothetical protein
VVLRPESLARYRAMSALEQVGRGGAMVGNQRHADARRHLQALAIEEHRF